MENPQKPRFTLALDSKAEGSFFDRTDKISIIAAVVDSTLIGIGLVVTVVWLSTIHSKPTRIDTSPWVPSSPVAAALVTPTTSPAIFHTEIMHICTLYVYTQFHDGSTHYVEFRGNCASLRSIAAHSQTPVRWLAVNTVSAVVAEK